MAEKIKLGMICDFAAPTGFATVSHNIASYLESTNKYDINVIGINYDGRPNEWAKRFNVWPARLGGDFLGIGLLPSFLKETKPDVFFMLQDFWNIPMYIAAAGPRPGLVAYYPVDAPNIKSEYMMGLAACAELCCYTEFGARESAMAAKEGWENLRRNAAEKKLNVIENITVNTSGGMDPITRGNFGAKDVAIKARRIQQMKNESNYNVIPHGVDITRFFPVPKALAREQMKFDNDWFIVSNVNRNQPRKRMDLSVKAFAEFAKDKPNARLVLHCVRQDSSGWDLPQLAIYYGCPDKVFFTDTFLPQRTATIEQLNTLYNACDVNINTGGGEGWGLTAIESAACRVPQIVPNWSATKEIWEGAGLLTNVISVRHEPSQINTMQAVIDTNHLVSQLNELYESKEKLEETGNRCYEVSQKKEYTWESVGKQFDKVFTKAVGKSPMGGPVGINTQGIIDIKKSGVK